LVAIHFQLQYQLQRTDRLSSLAELKNHRKNQKHILSVDDSVDHQILLKTLLESVGYLVHCTENCREALALLHSEALPDLILCDLQMPVMMGDEFLKCLSLDLRFNSIPTILISASELLVNQKSAICADEFLIKPLQIDKLINAVERLLSRNSLSDHPDTKSPAAILRS